MTCPQCKGAGTVKVKITINVCSACNGYGLDVQPLVPKDSQSLKTFHDNLLSSAASLDQQQIL